MALTGDDALALAKSYVKKTADGLGAVKGKDGFSPIISEDPSNTETDYRLNITTESNSFKTPNLKGSSGGDGFSPTITENPENDTNTYRLDITNKDGSFTTPNLKGKDGTIGGGGAVGSEMVWYPTVSSNGDISWEKAETDVPPIPVNIKGTPGENGLSPTITENPDNTDSVYKLDIVTVEGEFTTPNLKGFYGGTICKNDGSPVGEIISFMGTAAPAGYLICDGSIYQIADYPYLAKNFKDNFGSENYFGGADGTFAVPDLRGEFLRGTGTNSHSNQGNGSAVGAHQNATIIPNVQSTSGGTEYISGYVNTSNYPVVANVDHSYTTEFGQSVNKVRVSTQTAKDVNDKILIKYNSRPTNTSVLYCIKYEPSFSVCVQHTYSFDEHVVGTWLDGKPLYEKTVDFGNLPNAGTKSVPHEIENADTIYVYDGYVYTPKNNTYSNLINANPKAQQSDWCCWIESDDVCFLTGVNRTESFGIVTLRYTKTTD